MLRCHHDDYALLLRQTPHVDRWSLERRIGAIDVFVPFLWGSAQQQTSTVYTTHIRLGTFRQFAELAQEPGELCAWAKTVDAAARGSGCAALVGLAVGYSLALPVWPLVLGGGALGAVAMGAFQQDTLQPAKVFASALTQMAELATSAEGATPQALASIREQLHRVIEDHLQGGTAVLILAAQLDRLLDAGM